MLYLCCDGLVRGNAHAFCWSLAAAECGNLVCIWQYEAELCVYYIAAPLACLLIDGH